VNALVTRVERGELRASPDLLEGLED